ncbi:nuclear transport factor 2 family protein [Sphingobium sp. SCG-1]|uniref:nuclear transport factor 2 family protein n=1 Tax=Sphingobium sp. SCG-1 TaxID=2072936 RepID=UPI00167092D5|nr:nuclear transport factor 2 family protein [Sphingobium sp. SCG-1]
METARYQKIISMVETIYALTASGDWHAVGEMLTEDFRIVEAEGLPYGGEYLGKTALQDLYTKVFAFWEDASLDRHDMAISEHNAIVMLTMHATSRHTGERLAMPMCEVLHVRGDKFSGITPYYYDTAAIARATGTLSLA